VGEEGAKTFLIYWFNSESLIFCGRRGRGEIYKNRVPDTLKD
jgi:hypothetical protein